MLQLANEIKGILNLNREPVGVKFSKKQDIIGLMDRYDHETKNRYCQALMRAGIQDGEGLIGIPFNKLRELTGDLRSIANKPMVKARSKSAFHSLKGCGE
jgi:uncharacterized protein (DUF169 family)